MLFYTVITLRNHLGLYRRVNNVYKGCLGHVLGPIYKIHQTTLKIFLIFHNSCPIDTVLLSQSISNTHLIPNYLQYPKYKFALDAGSLNGSLLECGQKVGRIRTPHLGIFAPASIFKSLSSSLDFRHCPSLWL